VICRGEGSELVGRVDGALHELRHKDTLDIVLDNDSIGFEGTTSPDKNSDLLLYHGWGPVLLEIKPYNTDANLAELSATIKKSSFADDRFVKWSDGYRAYEIGYMKTLILACMLNESERVKEDLADDIAERFEGIQTLIYQKRQLLT
jgi:translation elongation factor EF-1beta